MATQTSQAAQPPAVQPPAVEVPGTAPLHSLDEYERSALLVLQFEPTGVRIDLMEEPNGETTTLPPLGPDAGVQMVRLFQLPDAGRHYRVLASKPGYGQRSVDLDIRPRGLYTVDLLLASEYDRDRLAFSAPGASGLDIFTIWPDGSHRTSVVSTPGDDTDPAFSPDGTRLAFSSNFEGDREIYVTDLGTGEIKRLTHSPGPDHSPAWSPDGRWVAFVSERTHRPTIWMVNVEDGSARRLTRPRLEDRDPCFSPDGAWLVFASRLGADLDGAGPGPSEALPRLSGSGAARGSAPLARPATGFDLAVLELRTGKIFPLTDEKGEASEPSWSPDGKTIVYRIEQGGRSTLDYVGWQAPSEGAGPLLSLPLLQQRGSFRWPRWAADGDGVAYEMVAEGADPGGKAQIRFTLAASALGPDRREFSAEVLSLPGPIQGLSWGKVPPDPNRPLIVRLETDQGNIDLQLFPEKAPKTVENFLRLVGQGFYDGLKFYRVVEGFVAQFGCPLNNGLGGPGWTIPLEETGLHHTRGAVSMVHGADPDSAGSQFFICLSDCQFLDGQFTVFGRVVGGMDALDRVRVGTAVQRAHILEPD